MRDRLLYIMYNYNNVITICIKDLNKKGWLHVWLDLRLQEQSIAAIIIVDIVDIAIRIQVI